MVTAYLVVWSKVCDVVDAIGLVETHERDDYKDVPVDPITVLEAKVVYP